MDRFASNFNAPLGPFADCDIYPLYGDPVVLQNLLLLRQGVRIGLEQLAEDVPSGRTDKILWRAVVQLEIHQLENGKIRLPHLSTHGSALVKAFARSQGRSLQTPTRLLIQGEAIKFHWTEAELPSFVLYSNHNGKQREFLVESLHPDSPVTSFTFLRSQYLLRWMQKVNKDQRNGPHDLDWYADQYIDKYPHIVPPEGLSDGGLRTQAAHFRSALVSLCGLTGSRQIIRNELLTSDATIELLSDYIDLQNMPRIPHEPFRPAPSSSPRRAGPPSEDQVAVKKKLDSLLLKLPMEYFDTPDIPIGSDAWTCPITDCETRILTKAATSTQLLRDEDLLHFRNAVGSHLWEHAMASTVANDICEVSGTTPY